jgi:microcin C transport system permease protein
VSPRLFQLNPIARKRWARFRALRRAWFSLIALVTLFLISLGAELICHRDPLAVRYNGRWVFPIFRFYPEDRFTSNGRMTRPDYKQIAADPAFLANPANRMIFAPIPYGPDEIIRTESIPVPPGIRLRFSPLGHSGAIQLDDAGIIRRNLGADSFFSPPDPPPEGQLLSDHWILPEPFKEAIAARLRNQAAPAVEATLRHARDPQLQALVSLPSFQPRTTPPVGVRINFEEILATAAPEDVRFDDALNPLPPVPPLWAGCPPATRALLFDAAGQSRTGTPDPLDIAIGQLRYRVTFLKPEIRWPYPPVANHWLGIDNAGRDVLARLLYGLRISLSFGLILTAAAMLIGIFVGAIQGYYGGRIDLAGQRFIEIWSALPFLYIMILLGAVYGRGFLLLLVCYGLFNWIGISYYLRGEFLRLRHQPFVDAARVMGLKDRVIMFRHILPNALVPVITFFPFSLVGAIGSLAALDYLGFGLPPPTPSWGEMLQQAQQFRWAWWLILYPSLALFIVMLLGIFIGEGVRQAYDPHRPSRWE